MSSSLYDNACFRLNQVDSTVAHKVSDVFVRFVAVTSTPGAMTTREIEEASAEDEEFSELRNCIMRGTWRNDQLKQYIPVASELCVIGKLILRGTRIVIPSKLRSRVLTLAHEGHPGIVSMRLKLLILLLQRMLSTQDQTIQTLRRIVEKQRLLHLQDLFVIRSCQRSLKTLI